MSTPDNQAPHPDSYYEVQRVNPAYFLLYVAGVIGSIAGWLLACLTISYLFASQLSGSIDSGLEILMMGLMTGFPLGTGIFVAIAGYRLKTTGHWAGALLGSVLGTLMAFVATLYFYDVASFLFMVLPHPLALIGWAVAGRFTGHKQQ